MNALSSYLEFGIDRSVGLVIAHYHETGRVADYLVNFVAHVAKRLTPHIVFVSTNLSEESEARLKPYCRVIRRDNVGYDFWSYKVGYDNLPKGVDWNRILMLNSSFIITHPATLLNHILQPTITNGMVGLTRSLALGEHLQSFCILFDGKKIIQSYAMKQWWKKMTPISDRDQVIKKYEIGMSAHFRENGFPLRAVFEANDAEKALALSRQFAETKIRHGLSFNGGQAIFNLADADHLNPTHYHWDHLLSRLGVLKFDFIKHSIYAQQLMSHIEKFPPPGVGAVEAVKDALT